ncbi:TPA: hypothetical protein PEC45_002417 [Staphylococcus aureus]|nr:hypothetical protein [Staphylococcus aureus]
MKININFEKQSPEEKAKKKAAKKAKRQEKYGHLTKAQDGSLAAYLSNLKNEMFPKDPDKDDKS